MNYGSEKEKEEIKNMFPIGVFQDIDKPGFFEAYKNLVNKVMKKDSKTPMETKPKVVVRK